MSSPWFRGNPARVVAALAAAVAPILLLSCGGDSDTPSPPGTGTGPQTGVVQIRGGDRLGWFQVASTVADLQAHSFRLYVDGVALGLSDTQCADTAGPSGYACSGRLPSMPVGSHVLELTAVVSGQESGRSPSLTVMFVAASQTGPGAAQTDGADPDVGAAGRATLASGLRGVAWLTTTPDGRLLFVENTRAVRVIEGDELLPEPAYVVDRPGTAIVGMAVDPQFARTRAVYIAWTEQGNDGARELRITRFRDVGDRLGEGATIVTGVPFPTAGTAPLGVDGDGLVYAAVPALDAGSAHGGASGTGFVLRFTADGTVPRSHPRGSPIVAAGFAQPTALAIDDAARRVWIAGTHPSWPHAIAAFPIDARPESAWPQLPRPVLPSGGGLSGMPVSSLWIAPALGDMPAFVDVIARRGAHRGSLAADGSIATIRLLNTRAFGEVSAIATGPDGQSYAAVGASGQLASIVRLPAR